MPSRTIVNYNSANCHLHLPKTLYFPKIRIYPKNLYPQHTAVGKSRYNSREEDARANIGEARSGRPYAYACAEGRCLPSERGPRGVRPDAAGEIKQRAEGARAPTNIKIGQTAQSVSLSDLICVPNFCSI